jgi:hypothetical protein
MTASPAHFLNMLKVSTGFNALSLTPLDPDSDWFDKFSVALRGLRQGSNYIRRSVRPVHYASLETQMRSQRPLPRLFSTGAIPRDYAERSMISYRTANGSPWDKRFYENRYVDSALGSSYGPRNPNKMINPKDLSMHTQLRIADTRNQILKDPEKRAALANYVDNLPPAPDELTRNFKRIMYPY